MAYELYFGNMLFPITPSKIEMKIKGKNKTLTLINDDEINFLKNPGLTEITFDLLLPNVKYPFAKYQNEKLGFRNAKPYLDTLELYKTRKKAFRFILTRTLPSGKILYDTNIKVSLEDYTIKEDAKQGFDVVVSVKLKQYRDFSTKICEVIDDDILSITTKRPGDNLPEESQSYTVVEGDCLWNLAKRFYGDGSKYSIIYNANKDKIVNPNLIYAGQVLTIPGATQDIPVQSIASSGSSNSSSSSSSNSSETTSQDIKPQSKTPTSEIRLWITVTPIDRKYESEEIRILQTQKVRVFYTLPTSSGTSSTLTTIGGTIGKQNYSINNENYFKSFIKI